MTREIYLNVVLPALIVAVGFGAAWLQGQQVKRMDRARQRLNPLPGHGQHPAE